MAKLSQIISSEYEIALTQLERLKQISEMRLLTSDEVKMYDLLVKNLRLIQEKPDVINTTYVKVGNDKDEEAKLIELVSGIKPIEELLVQNVEKPSTDEE